MGCAWVDVRLVVVTVRVFAVLLVRLLGTGKAMIWESNEWLATDGRQWCM
jgi:hypothetical protein